MNALCLPAFVPELLRQGTDPRDVPTIAASDIVGWATPLASAVFGALMHSDGCASFLSNGHAYLPVPRLATDEASVYVRIPLTPEAVPWPAARTAVVLTLAGSALLELHAEQQPGENPQYVRHFPVESTFAIHPGALCLVQSETEAVQLVVTDGLPAPVGRVLTPEEYRLAVVNLRARLSRFTDRQPSPPASGSSWLDDWPAMNSPDLQSTFAPATELLERLVADRGLLSRLVHGIEDDPERRAGSRVTLLLDRLCLYRAPEHGFEVRLNMNPRRVNQEVPHDHGYNFATRILTGGYVHVVRRRTDSGEGPFTGKDLLPAVVAVERPGSAYTLRHTAVHQAIMLPGTTTLFVRGPRLKTRTHAAEELMPTPDTWPAAADGGPAQQHSRPASLDEYRSMRDQLAHMGLIDPAPIRPLVRTPDASAAS
ncbi:hypothetical protein AB0D12_33830 [Streptomyces sp. NPDC048479]|uniref:hypothetical protein n=1 Tax=Streptomyces sp. NPDC048479 TaxID=3154725 RepID=UPI00342D025E